CGLRKTAGLVEMQVAALDHLAAVAPGLPVPRVIRRQDGAGNGTGGLCQQQDAGSPDPDRHGRPV
ncbi:MAG TPA: hypothetical protein DGU02_09370, partial [Alphaproteobacteria bacterium]|nr:hypothetical protein [Alphaproteobacteria bacterium]